MSDEKRNPETPEEEDVEGHNIFATQDYFRQVSHERSAQVEREARQREAAKEAKDANKNRR